MYMYMLRHMHMQHRCEEARSSRTSACMYMYMLRYIVYKRVRRIILRLRRGGRGGALICVLIYMLICMLIYMLACT